MSDGMASRLGSAVGSTVVKNPIFMKSVTSSMWQSLSGSEESEAAHGNQQYYPQQPKQQQQQQQQRQQYGQQQQRQQYGQQQQQQQQQYYPQQQYHPQQQQYKQQYYPQQPWPLQQPIADNSINCTKEEYEEMNTAMRRLRWWYLSVSSFMILTALLSLTSLSVLADGFLAFYVFIFSCLICCYELHWKMFTRFILQNFGFLYNSPGRILFMIFLAMLSYSLGKLFSVINRFVNI